MTDSFSADLVIDMRYAPVHKNITFCRAANQCNNFESDNKKSAFFNGFDWVWKNKVDVKEFLPKHFIAKS